MSLFPSESYQNLARKYRPQNFSEIVGQEAVTKTLANSLRLGRVAHAYLFYGPRGCGKTTVARILAKALNCTGGKDDKPAAEPCGKCPQCVEIAASADLDVLEIDAASNTQVEKVREVIIDTVALSSSRDRYKVFILDEAHMLSTSSFNALLKTIEEPPPHVVFMLATTERGKIPATIASRCQSFRFKPIAQDQIAAHLSGIAAKEKLEINAEAVEILAKASSGALRDALTLLDRSAAYAQGGINAATVSEMLGRLPEEIIQSAVSAMLARDAQALHKVLESVRSQGHDPVSFVRDIKQALADLFYLGLGFGREPFPGAKAACAKTSPLAIAHMVRRIARVVEEVKFSEMPSIAAEVGLFTVMEAAPDIEGFLKRLEGLEQRLSSGAEPPPVRPASPEAPAARPKPEPAKPEHPARPHAAAAAKQACDAPAGPVPDGVLWKSFTDCLNNKNPLLHDIMLACRVEFKGDEWSLAFPDAFRKEAAERNLSKLGEIMRSLSNRDIIFKFCVAQGKAQRPQPEPDALAQGAEETQISDEQPFAQGGLEWQDIAGDDAIENNSAVKHVLKIIPGKIIRHGNDKKS